MSSSAGMKWAVAASIAAVEALKDQGIARWNYPIRCVNQHLKNNIRSYSHAKKLSSQSSAVVSNKVRDQSLNQSEESLRKVMFLSCWGPN